MTTQRNVEIVRSLYDRFNDGDLESVVGLCSTDVELLDVPSGMVFTGRDGVRAWMQAWKTAAKDAQTEVTSIIADGDRVATEHTGRGTHTGPIVSPAGEIPPTGRRFELRFAEVFEFRDGQIVRFRAYADTMSFLRQIGVDT